MIGKRCAACGDFLLSVVKALSVVISCLGFGGLFGTLLRPVVRLQLPLLLLLRLARRARTSADSRGSALCRSA